MNDDETAPLVSRLLYLADRIRQATDEQNGIRARLRELGAGEHGDGAGHIVRITPTRRFDPAAAAEQLPADLVGLISETTVSPAKARDLLPPATYEKLMTEVGQPRVTITEATQ